jgi:hypothetical protein
MPAPYTTGPQSALATFAAAGMGVMTAEVLTLHPSIPNTQAGLLNILVDFFTPLHGVVDPVGAGVYAGQLFVNTTAGTSFLWNGTTWKKLKYDP